MRTTTILAVVLMGLIVLGNHAAAGDLRDIELRRLLEPTPAEVQAERSGRIYIYEGLRESDVERAMEEGFDRVDSMMFIRIQRPVPKSDPNAHEPPSYYTGDDGC